MTRRMRWALVILALLVAVITFSEGDSEGAEDNIKVTPGFAVLAGKGASTYALVKLDNSGSADKLVGATSPVSKVELHIMDGSKMVPVASIDVPKGETLLSGQEHLMLVGLNKDLKLGEKVSVTLDFEKSNDVTVEIPVTQADGHAHKH